MISCPLVELDSLGDDCNRAAHERAVNAAVVVECACVGMTTGADELPTSNVGTLAGAPGVSQDDFYHCHSV